MEKKNVLRILVIVTVMVTLISQVAIADMVVLKDSKVMQGTYKGGNEASIIFEVDGKLITIAVADVTSLTFTPRTAAAAVPPPLPLEATTHTMATGPITIPAGTKLMIKLDKDVSTATHKTGSSITAHLETNLVVGGVVAVPKGTLVYGKVVKSRGGKRIGKQFLVFEFNNFSIKSQLVPISTDMVGAEGGQGGAVRKAGAGALIGSAIDGSKGARKGALAVGGLALLSQGKHISIPAGSLAEVSLKQAVTIPY